MDGYSAILFCRKLAPVPHVSNYSTIMEFWPIGLALLSSCICSSYSALCSSRLSSRPPRRIHLKIADLVMTGEQASAVLQIILVALNSLYHCTILLFFTPHCSYLWGLCVKNQVLCAISLSLVNAVQRCIILILVCIHISIVYSYIQNT